MTATQPTRSGYLTVLGANTARPTVSNLNFAAGQTVANLATVDLGTDGDAISIYNGSSGTTQSSPTSSATTCRLSDRSRCLRPGQPCAPRVDTRIGLGAPRGGAVQPPRAGRHAACRPARRPRFINLTVTGGSRSGPVAVNPDVQIDISRQPSTVVHTSNLAYPAGPTTANQAMAQLTSGVVSVQNLVPAGVDAIVDVTGYTVGPHLDWTTAASIDSGAAVTGISCPTDAFCAGVDDAGRAVRFNGTTWSTPRRS